MLEEEMVHAILCDRRMPHCTGLGLRVSWSIIQLAG